MENFGANFGENDNLLCFLDLWTKEKVKENYIWTTERHTFGKLPCLNNYTLKKRKMEKQAELHVALSACNAVIWSFVVEIESFIFNS